MYPSKDSGLWRSSDVSFEARRKREAETAFPILAECKDGTRNRGRAGRGWGKPVQTGLQAFAELRVECDNECQPEVVLGLAAEAVHEIVELTEADRNYGRSSPVITTAKSRGKCIVRD